MLCDFRDFIATTTTAHTRQQRMVKFPSPSTCHQFVPHPRHTAHRAPQHNKSPLCVMHYTLTCDIIMLWCITTDERGAMSNRVENYTRACGHEFSSTCPGTRQHISESDIIAKSKTSSLGLSGIMIRATKHMRHPNEWNVYWVNCVLIVPPEWYARFHHHTRINTDILRIS